MIEFIEKIQEALPYDREIYIDFLDDDFNALTKWNGLSFQLNTEEKEIGLVKFFKFYEPLFKNVILKLDNGTPWIVNHDYYSDYWFPNRENTLSSLRKVFRENKISYKFIGALIFMKDDLLEFSTDLLSYPFAMFKEDKRLYSSLDISHSKLEFIIKISDHWNIDFLSTDKKILKKISDENSSNFSVKEYRGTSL